jgi:hypothetical protein
MSQVADPRAALRQTVYLLLIVVSTGAMLGRILAVDALDATQRKRPFLSANDRSRWCTLRALVEPGMRVPGAPYAIDKVIKDHSWDTIDKVKHAGHYYSSKPTLLPTLQGGVYWLVYHLAGWSLGRQTYATVRLLLVLFNVAPLVVYFVLLSRLAERLGKSDWSRVFVMAAACFGTFLTTFAVTLNNHVPGAVSAAIAIYAVVRIWFDGQRRWRYFFLAGLFAALTAADELPALSLLAALSAVALWKSPAKTLLALVPAAVLVAAGFFGTNWIAFHSLRPAYLHRSQTDPADNWYAYKDEKGRSGYWQNPVGIDRGEPSAAVYALHALVGHHGIFSLTPVWVLSVVGLGIWLARPGEGSVGNALRGVPQPTEKGCSRFPERHGGRSLQAEVTSRLPLRELALLIAAVSLVCLLFYLSRPQNDRNYGGMTSGLRWMFWFTPMWLVAMLPALDAMAGHRWLRGLAWLMLGVSVLSASYPTWNPWTHPWLLNYLHYMGWLKGF